MDVSSALYLYCKTGERGVHLLNYPCIKEHLATILSRTLIYSLKLKLVN